MTKDHGPLPLGLDKELQHLGVLPSTPFEDDLEEMRPHLKTEYKYNMPDLDENGEPDF